MAEFDVHDRERIRAALIGYMKEHHIGVPTLAKRIERAHPRHMEIPLKTLQRFLAGNRTQDMALNICAAFADALPNKPTVLQLIGQSTAAFYESYIPPNLANNYTITSTNHESDLTISAPVNNYCIVTQRSKQPHRILDGVLFSPKLFIYTVLLKDRLTSKPRILIMKENSTRHGGERFTVNTIDDDSGFIKQ